MSIKKVTIPFTFHPQNPNSTLEFKVTIGDGQPNTYSIYLNDDLVAPNKTYNCNTTDVLNKTVFVSSMLREILSTTKWVSLTVQINESNQTQPIIIPYKEQLEAQFDVVRLLIKIQIAS